MPPPKEPTPLPSNADEARRTNLLLERMQRDISTVAEGVVDLQRKTTLMATQLQAVTDDMAVVKPVVQQNTRDIAQNTRDISEIKAGIGRIEQQLTSFNQRLTTVEQKVAV